MGGKVCVKWQKYLGSAQSIVDRLEQAQRLASPVKQHSAPFGALFLANVLEKELDTISIVDEVVQRAPNEKGPTVGEYFFYAWANRMIAPKSKRASPTVVSQNGRRADPPCGVVGTELRALLGKMEPGVGSPIGAHSKTLFQQTVEPKDRGPGKSAFRHHQLLHLYGHRHEVGSGRQGGTTKAANINCVR